jgi:(p)ppGpp synthase/HD superfamily hydrolase
MEDTLKNIIDFADQAHGEQMRKFTPERYIVHPIRVMEICKEYTDDITILAAALLHDVLEDTPVTKEKIHEFLVKVIDKEDAVKTVTLVEELTDIYIKSDYPQWNRRKRKAKEAERLGKTSADSQTVKYADIIDNSTEIVNHKTDFAHVYLFESKALLKRMTQGDQRLYQRALETVDKCIEQLSAK